MIKRILSIIPGILLLIFIALIPGQFVVSYETNKIINKIKPVINAMDKLCKSDCTDSEALKLMEMEIPITDEQTSYCKNVCKQPKKLKEKIIAVFYPELHFENPYYEMSKVTFCLMGLRCPYTQLNELINN